MDAPLERMSWDELERELQRLHDREDKDLGFVLQELEIREEELERQKRELIDAQRVLEYSRDRYQELFELLPAGYLTLSRRGVILEINPAGADLLGRPREALLGHSLYPFVADGPALAGHLERVTQQGEPVREELALLRGEQPEVPVELFSSRSRHRPEVCRTALTDLSERRQREQERRELWDRERDAREASEAKDRFIAMLSHELRTPLTPVLAAAVAVAEDAELPARIRPLLEQIRQGVLDEARLIDDLLDLTRLRRGRMRVEPTAVDAHEAIRQALRAVPGAERVGLALSAERDRLRADPVRFIQIVTNLLDNALAATREGGEVELRTSNPAAGSFRLDVSDTGLGIDAEDLERVFDPFERVEAPGRDGGLGLGLAISRTLAEAHGGRLEAKSEGRGRGSRLSLDLPLGSRAEAARGAAPEPPPPRARRGRSLRILLVDDHAGSATAVRLLLQRQGYTVELATSLAGGLAAGADFDVLISDIVLGDGTGHQLLRQLRAARPDLPAIALSGFGAASDVKASLDAGFDEHLTKPSGLLRLVASVERLAPR